MAEKRKLQLEMDKVFKKIEDGFEVFDQMNEKLNEAKNDNQREKFQDELKKEIKRLQRLRVQIKTWQQEPMIKSPDLKEKDKKDKLADYRRAVEQRMESFKDIESKSKLKPYSKVALSLSMQEEKEERDERDESYFDSYSSGEMADLSQSPSKEEEVAAAGKEEGSSHLPPSPPPSPSRVRPPMMTVQPTTFHQTETETEPNATSPHSAPSPPTSSSSSSSSASSTRSRSPSAPLPSTLQQAGERRTEEDENSLTVLDQESAGVGEGVPELHVDFDAGLNPFFATASLPEGEDQEHSLEDQHTLEMLQRSADTCPLPMDSEVVHPHVRKMFRPAQCYPQTTFLTGPAERYDSCHLPLDALFFLFYHTPGSESQMLAAKALQKLSWRFHTQLQQWFRRLEDPTETTDEFERGSYVFFDSEMWAQREMTEFTFEYKYLLDFD